MAVNTSSLGRTNTKTRELIPGSTMGIILVFTEDIVEKSLRVTDSPIFIKAFLDVC